MQYGVYGLLLLVLTVFIYHLREYVNENEVRKQYGDWLERRRRLRSLREEDIRKTEGKNEKLSFFHRLDLMLLQSNLNRAFPFLSSEVYLLGSVATATATGILLVWTYGVWWIGLISVGLVLFLSYFILFSVTMINQRKLEGNVVTFLNLLENYSKTSDDILKIFGQTHPFLDEPLRTYIRDFYFEAMNDGDVTKAFHNLEIRVGQEKLQEIIHNIEICSRHEANYEEIIKDNRLSLNEYLSVKEEKKAIVNNGRVEILLLLGASGVCLSIFGGLVKDMKGVLLGTFGGNLLLGFSGMVLLYCFWVMATMERR